MNKKLLLIGTIVLSMSISGCGLLNGLTPNLGSDSKESSHESEYSYISHESTSSGTSSKESTGTSETHTSQTTPSTETNESTRENLPTPILRIDPSETGICWDIIPEAIGYEVIHYNNEYSTINTFVPFVETSDNVELKVRAIASNSLYNSDWAVYRYLSHPAYLFNDLTYNKDDRTLLWNSFDGVGINLYLNDVLYGQYGMNDNGTTIYSGGIYTAEARPGLIRWDDYPNAYNKCTYYYTPTNSTWYRKSIMITIPAANPNTILDGSEMSNQDLQNKWVREYLGTTGWVQDDMYSNIELTEEYANVTQSGKCAKLSYIQANTAFRFTKDNIPMSVGYKTISADAKGDGVGNVYLVMTVSNDFYLGGVNLKGAYAMYNAGILPSQWYHYDVPLSDPLWRFYFQNQEYSLIEFVNNCKNSFGVQVDSVSDFLQCISSFGIIIQNTGSSNNNFSSVYVDNLNFNNSNRSGSMILEVPTLQDKYTYRTHSISGEFFNDGYGKWFMTCPINTIFPSGVGTVGLSINPSTLNIEIQSLTYGITFLLTAITEDLGWSFRADSLNADDANIVSYLSGFEASAGGVVDKFDYTELGAGYDQMHTIDQMTPGLRSCYFADYNVNSTPAESVRSPFGGTWSLMGSTDYLMLDTENGHNSVGCAKLKVNASMWMRYSSFGVINGTANAWPKGKSFSIWINNPNDSKVSSAYLRLFTKNNLAGNIEDGTLKMQINIPANSGWFEVKVDLDTNKTYYGFSIALGNTSALGGKYIMIDDAGVYSNYNTI